MRPHLPRTFVHTENEAVEGVCKVKNFAVFFCKVKKFAYTCCKITKFCKVTRSQKNGLQGQRNIAQKSQGHFILIRKLQGPEIVNLLGGLKVTKINPRGQENI